MSVESSSSRLDSLKWLAVLVIVAAGVVGNSYYSGESLLYRVLALVALALVAGYIAATTAKGAALWSLVRDSRTEIRKVVWPTRQEAVQTTMIVLVFVVVVALLLWGLDALLGWLVGMVIG
jgi:preprotein translocase subunit SecE